jgi:hypothetical protein
MYICPEMAIVARHVTARDVTAVLLPIISEEMPGAGSDYENLEERPIQLVPEHEADRSHHI